MLNQSVFEISNILSSTALTANANMLIIMSALLAVICVLSFICLLGSVIVNMICSAERKRTRKMFREFIATLETELISDPYEEEQNKVDTD